MTMGDRIKRLRKQEKITQEELGKCLSVKKSAIAKYEKGQVENIPRSTILKLAQKFNVSPEYILAFGDDEKKEYITDSMIEDFLRSKYGEEMFRFFVEFSSMTDENRNKLFGLCEVIQKAEKYDKTKEMLANL